MSDLYSELLVKKEKTGKDTAVKYGLSVLTALFVFLGLFYHPIILIGAIGLGIACFIMLPKTDVEFEYLFVNGELDITEVYSKSKRNEKGKKTFSLHEADLMAPVKSHRMDYYNSNQKMKVMDFSSGNQEHKRFAIITRYKNESVKVIIEPDETLATAMKNSAPNKVFLD